MIYKICKLIIDIANKKVYNEYTNRDSDLNYYRCADILKNPKHL